jgi:hypothetical protein
MLSWSESKSRSFDDKSDLFMKILISTHPSGVRIWEHQYQNSADIPQARLFNI